MKKMSLCLAYAWDIAGVINKNKAGNRTGVFCVIFDRVVIEALFEEVAFEQKPERSEKVSHVKMEGQRIPSRGSRKCKGPGAGVCLSEEGGQCGWSKGRW